MMPQSGLLASKGTKSLSSESIEQNARAEYNRPSRHQPGQEKQECTDLVPTIGGTQIRVPSISTRLRKASSTR